MFLRDHIYAFSCSIFVVLTFPVVISTRSYKVCPWLYHIIFFVDDCTVLMNYVPIAWTAALFKYSLNVALSVTTIYLIASPTIYFISLPLLQIISTLTFVIKPGILGAAANGMIYVFIKVFKKWCNNYNQFQTIFISLYWKFEVKQRSHTSMRI